MLGFIALIVFIFVLLDSSNKKADIKKDHPVHKILEETCLSGELAIKYIKEGVETSRALDMAGEESAYSIYNSGYLPLSLDSMSTLRDNPDFAKKQMKAGGCFRTEAFLIEQRAIPEKYGPYAPNYDNPIVELKSEYDILKDISEKSYKFIAQKDTNIVLLESNYNNLMQLDSSFRGYKSSVCESTWLSYLRENEKRLHELEDEILIISLQMIRDIRKRRKINTNKFYAYDSRTRLLSWMNKPIEKKTHNWNFLTDTERKQEIAKNEANEKNLLYFEQRLKKLNLSPCVYEFSSAKKPEDLYGKTLIMPQRGDGHLHLDSDKPWIS